MITAIPAEAPSVDGLELPALDIVPVQIFDALPSNPVTVGLLVIAVTGAPRWRATRVLVAHLVPRAMVPREFHLGQKLAARAEDRLPVQILRILMVGLLARGVARLAAVPSQILAIGAFALLPAPNSSRHPSRLSTALRAHTRTHTHTHTLLAPSLPLRHSQDLCDAGSRVAKDVIVATDGVAHFLDRRVTALVSIAHHAARAVAFT